MTDNLVSTHDGLNAAMDLHLALHDDHKWSGWWLDHETDQAFLVHRLDNGTARYLVGATCFCGETWGKPGYPWITLNIEVYDGDLRSMMVPLSVVEDVGGRCDG